MLIELKIMFSAKRILYIMPMFFKVNMSTHICTSKKIKQLVWYPHEKEINSLNFLAGAVLYSL